jgi:hypothetical protein
VVVTNNVPERNIEWDFSGAVRSSFSFLGDRGFHITDEGDGWVRFDSPSVTVTIRRDRLEYSLNLEVALSGDTASTFSLDELEIISGNPETPIMRPHSRSEMRDDVALIARALRNLDAGLLSGEPGSWRVATVRGEKLRQIIRDFYSQTDVVPKLPTQSVAEWADARRSVRQPAIDEFRQSLVGAEPFPELGP